MNPKRCITIKNLHGKYAKSELKTITEIFKAVHGTKNIIFLRDTHACKLECAQDYLIMITDYNYYYNYCFLKTAKGKSNCANMLKVPNFTAFQP